MELTFCKQCVMDGSDSNLILDENGICNHCHSAQRMLKETESDKDKLDDIIKKIKEDGKNKEYDVIIGLSGGVDSSTVLCRAVELGLRPYCFSVDNGWNNPDADENILKLVEGLKVPFNRYVLDFKKFTELQGAFMKAGLINIEIPTDHILMALSLKTASDYGVKWILSGGNVATESIMPESWSYSARDLWHIKDVYKKMTSKKLTGLPVCGIAKWNYYKWIKGIRTLYLLDYSEYNRDKEIKLLQEKFGYKPYGLKHSESIFTAWFQSFYLYEKFGIDKRKAHFSSLINSGQMTREKAVEELAYRPIYPELGIEKKVMQYKKRSHYDFKTDEKLWKLLVTFVRLLRKLSMR